MIDVRKLRNASPKSCGECDEARTGCLWPGTAGTRPRNVILRYLVTSSGVLIVSFM